MNHKVARKLQAVARAVKQLDKVHHTAGRTAMRNARRSTWARIRALQEEIDASYVLPKQAISPRQLTWEGKAKRMTGGGFNREVADLQPEWWPIRDEKPTPDQYTSWLTNITMIAATSCAEHGVPAPMIDATKKPGLLDDLPQVLRQPWSVVIAPDVFGVRDIAFSGFYRRLATWILQEQGKLKVSKRKKAGPHWPLTAEGATQVNLMIVELLRLNGAIS